MRKFHAEVQAEAEYRMRRLVRSGVVERRGAAAHQTMRDARHEERARVTDTRPRGRGWGRRRDGETLWTRPDAEGSARLALWTMAVPAVNSCLATQQSSGAR